MFDAAGNSLVDFVLGMGPMLLGHANPTVHNRVADQMKRGVVFGTTDDEFELARRVAEWLPHAEHVAYASTGSEATHLAIRVARATTGRRLIVKFEGHYHGWVDPLFVNTQHNAPGGPAAFPIPGQHGFPALPMPEDVAVIRWNDLADVSRVFEAHAGEIAGVIMEPIPLNFGTMLPDPGYLEAVRAACDRNGALLIFDEVLSGFRLARGGAAELLGVLPDLAVYAKAIASGFPFAMLAGTQRAMSSIVDGPVQPAGTYSGNLVSVTAALATLEQLDSLGADLYKRLEAKGDYLRRGLTDVARAAGVPLTVNQIGSVLQLFWGLDDAVRSYADAARTDRARVAALCERQLEHGAHVAPRGLLLLSSEHDLADLDVLVDGVERVLHEGIPSSTTPTLTGWQKRR